MADATDEPRLPCGCPSGIAATGGLSLSYEPITTFYFGDDREFYGLAEIAQALHRKRKKVAKWYRKGKLPEPTDVLATGPIWTAEALRSLLHPEPVSLRDVLPRFQAEPGGITYRMPPTVGRD